MTVKPMKVYGSDVSHHQGSLDLAKAKREGLEFLYHKATEGDSFVDAEYASRRNQARKVGLPFGAYHFARPERGDAITEARRFISVAKPIPGDLFPCLDLETEEGLSRNDLATWAKVFSREVKRLTGVLPVLYCPWDLGLSNIRWIPRYNNTNTPPVLKWDIWQFSNGQLGVPKTFPGLGNVDLNTLRGGFKTSNIIIPNKEKPVPNKKTQRLRYAHCSMQYSDTAPEMKHDARILLDRNYDILTITEAGPSNPLRDIFEREAEKNNYHFHAARGNGILIDEDLIKGRYKTGFVPVVESTEGVGQHSDRGIAWARFDTHHIGTCTVGCGHYMTKGRRAGDPNRKLNIRMGAAIQEWGTEAAEGADLAFYSGDQNIVDRDNDTFFGGDFTSSWDELKRWENTGHGNIDVIASWDKDGRVRARRVDAFNDSEVKLNTDHYLVETVFEIAVLD